MLWKNKQEKQKWKAKWKQMAGSNAIEFRPYQGYDIAFFTHHKEYCLRQRKMALILRLYIHLPLFAFTSLISMETWKRARRSYNLCGCWSHTNKKTSEEKKTNITAHTNEWMWISHLRSKHTKKDPSLVVAGFFYVWTAQFSYIRIVISAFKFTTSKRRSISRQTIV